MPKPKKTSLEKEIVRKSNILGKIEHIELFDEYNKHYAIIINKVVYHAIRLVSYDGEESKIKVVSVKRFPNLVEFYRDLDEAKEKAVEIKKMSQELLSKESPPALQSDTGKFETQEDDIKNILVIGRTGNGKSALANVLLNKNGNFEEVFKESSRGISETKNFEKEIFEWEGTKYRIVDTIGAGDTKLSKKEVLYKIAEGVYSMKGGINQIFLVVGGRFTKEEVESFVMIKSAVLGGGVANHTTIVRTRFPDFKDSSKCNEDRELLKEENRKIFDLIESCSGIVYVDNPRIN